MWIEPTSLEELASSLSTSVTWNPTWFNKYESLFGVSRKISIATAVPHERVLCLLAENEDFSPNCWVRRSRAASAYLPRLLDISPMDCETMWVDQMLRRSDSTVISAGFRYCKSCMKTGFHSCLHQLYLIDECPVHRVKLTTSCPHCSAPNDASLSDIDSFTMCYRCKAPFFPPKRDWLHDFEVSDLRTPLFECAEKLRKRSDSLTTESLWRPMDQLQRKVGVDERPTFLTLGQLWLSSDYSLHNRQAIRSQTVSTDVYFRMGLRVRRLEELAVNAVRRLANFYACDLIGIQWRKTHRRLANDMALWLVITRLGLHPSLVVSRAGTLNLDLLLGAIAGDNGYAVDSPDALEYLMNTFISALFSDAVDWLVNKPKGSEWDNWLQGGRQLTTPMVWIGLPVEEKNPPKIEEESVSSEAYMMIFARARDPSKKATNQLEKMIMRVKIEEKLTTKYPKPYR